MIPRDQSNYDRSKRIIPTMRDMRMDTYVGEGILQGAGP